jgi:hypothetical protein
MVVKSMDCTDDRDADLRYGGGVCDDGFEENNASWVTHDEIRRSENAHNRN